MTPAWGGGGCHLGLARMKEASYPCGPSPWSPDIGLDAHAAVLEAGVHCEVNGVGGFSAVVLMDQH